jgi:glycosyltransferase involved in cell wall biosynthesis
MIGIVIPAHNEERHLSACLDAVRAAAVHPALAGEEVRIVVALDACSDGSAAIARRHGVAAIRLQARNVGVARARGAELLLRAGARWLAFTDADTVVSPDWLAQQLLLGAEAVCGTVAVESWEGHAPQVQARFERDYLDRDGHRHIHGANFGISAQTYRRVGGFPPLACHEDVAMVRALQAIGARIAWSARPRVVTSARHCSKARGGFGDTLRGWGGESVQGGRSPTDGVRWRGGSASASSPSVAPEAVCKAGDQWPSAPAPVRLASPAAAG